MYTYVTLIISIIAVTYQPLKENLKDDNAAPDTHIQSRAGLTDLLNPTNNQNSQTQTTNNSPLTGGQNLLNNLPLPKLNGSGNPLEQLFSSSLKDAKVFFVTTQGIVVPASGLANGFQSLFTNLGSNLGLPSWPPGK